MVLLELVEIISWQRYYKLSTYLKQNTKAYRAAAPSITAMWMAQDAFTWYTSELYAQQSLLLSRSGAVLPTIEEERIIKTMGLCTSGKS